MNENDCVQRLIKQVSDLYNVPCDDVLRLLHHVFKSSSPLDDAIYFTQCTLMVFKHKHHQWLINGLKERYQFKLLPTEIKVSSTLAIGGWSIISGYAVFNDDMSYSFSYVYSNVDTELTLAEGAVFEVSKVPPVTDPDMFEWLKLVEREFLEE